MYTDNESDKDSEYDEQSADEFHNVIKKSLSTVCFRSSPENQCARPLALRATQSFTGPMEDIRLSHNFQRMNLSNRTNDACKPKVMCPCGCFLSPPVIGPFRTREKNTLALHVVPPEVLNYHGYNFDPNQIAMFWKKDCRMFLWKGKAQEKNLDPELHKN